MTEEYAFQGRVIRLNQADFDRWEKTFHTIPDLRAELEFLDAWLAEEKPKNWFVTASAILNKRHQARVAAQKGQTVVYDENDPATELLRKHGIPPIGPAGY